MAISQQTFDTPILMIMFNRPYLAIRVFERVKQMKPASLFLAVDGPRSQYPDETDAVNQCQQIAESVDWPCQVHTLFRETNLGCKKAVSSAIDWFFEHVEAGIILEDDCLPDLTFFDFCQVLLHRYTHEASVMHIGGANLYSGLTWGEETYFFSSIPHIWGWATWRRAWKSFDITMSNYPQFRKNQGIRRIVDNTLSGKYWQNLFDKTYANEIDTWDFQWVFAIWSQRGLSIIPNQNLITNIGFGEAATHTVNDTEFANLSTQAIDISRIIHPSDLVVNHEAVEYAFEKMYQPTSWFSSKVKAIKKRLATYTFITNSN